MKKPDLSAPLFEYEKNISRYKSEAAMLGRKTDTISRLRLLISVIGTLSVVLLLEHNYLLPGFITAIFTMAVFVFFVFRHEDVRQKEIFCRNLIKINSDSILRINGSWHSFSKTGDLFKDENHPFSGDLDIFGQGSLYQLINTPNTLIGLQRLKDFLLSPDKDIQSIIKRQTSVDELSKKLDFRQKLQAICLDDGNLLKDPSEIVNWAEQDGVVLKLFFQKLLIRTLPVITLLLIVISFMFPGVSCTIILPSLIIQLVLLLVWRRDIDMVFRITSRHRESIKQYLALIKHIERESFSSEYLENLQLQLTGKNGKPASRLISELDSIIDYMNMRFSFLHFVTNALTLWDLHCLISIDKWKIKSGTYLRSWFKSVAEIEALSSLAVLMYDNPDWVFPSFTENRLVFSAEQAGHPLIHDDIRVCNDFTIENAGSFAVITGSNMSGKSTMLRTVGLNLVLAYSGAPVCAQKMCCSVMDICSSMRITDNLEKKVSTFYAELVKIKMIIESARMNRPLIVLLDEILKGTNNRDRRIGVESVIKNLSRYPLLGIVSTHDLEVAGISGDEQLKISNYHFREDYRDNRIFFDYNIHNGSYNGSDAIYLMRMIGIDI